MAWPLVEAHSARCSGKRKGNLSRGRKLRDLCLYLQFSPGQSDKISWQERREVKFSKCLQLLITGDAGKVEDAWQCWGPCCRLCVTLFRILINARCYQRDSLSF